MYSALTKNKKNKNKKGIRRDWEEKCRKQAEELFKRNYFVDKYSTTTEMDVINDFFYSNDLGVNEQHSVYLKNTLKHNTRTQIPLICGIEPNEGTYGIKKLQLGPRTEEEPTRESNTPTKRIKVTLKTPKFIVGTYPSQETRKKLNCEEQELNQLLDLFLIERKENPMKSQSKHSIVLMRKLYNMLVKCFGGNHTIFFKDVTFQ